MENPGAPKPYYARAWPPACFSSEYLLGEMRSRSIDSFARRSELTVLSITFVFALGGGLLDIIGHFGGAAMFWGIWIPFCCLLIPTIFYLSRQVVELRERLDALEARVESSADAGKDGQ